MSNVRFPTTAVDFVLQDGTRMSDMSGRITAADAKAQLALDTASAIPVVDLSAVQSQIDGLTFDVGVVTTNLASTDGEVAAVKTDITALQTDVGALYSQVTAVDNSVGTIAAGLATASDNIAAHDILITALQNDTVALSGQVSSNLNAIGTLEVNVGTLQTDLGTAQGDITALQASISDIVVGWSLQYPVTFTASPYGGGFSWTGEITFTPAASWPVAMKVISMTVSITNPTLPIAWHVLPEGQTILSGMVARYYADSTPLPYFTVACYSQDASMTGQICQLRVSAILMPA